MDQQIGKGLGKDVYPEKGYPLVSVWLPTLNREAYLRHAIDSVLHQTYPAIQLIVVDDGSSDGTSELIHERLAKLPPGRELIYIHNSEPRGASAARNQAIFRAEGEFATGLDDDDQFMPDRIAAFVEAYKDEYAGVASSFIEIGSQYHLDSRQPRQLIDAQAIRSRNRVGNQVFTRTQRLREINGFDEALPGWQDYDCWLRLIDAYGPVLKLSRPSYLLNREEELQRITCSSNAEAGYLAFMQRHGHSMTESQRRTQKVNNLYNRSAKLGWSEFYHLFSRETATRLISLVLKVRVPRLYRALVRGWVFVLSHRTAGRDDV